MFDSVLLMVARPFMAVAREELTKLLDRRLTALAGRFVGQPMPDMDPNELRGRMDELLCLVVYLELGLEPPDGWTLPTLPPNYPFRPPS